MIIYIKHIDIEGPGTLGDFLTGHDFDSRIIEMNDKAVFPNPDSAIDAVISLGGPMNVYEEKKYPFLARENKFIQEVVAREIPFLGLCLGSQLLAKACGGRVIKSPSKEIGFSRVELTPKGQSDDLFKGLDPSVFVFQWHEDMSEIPEGGILLATSAQCPSQAFRFGSSAYALQFHVEITDVSIREWSDKYITEHKECESMKNIMLNKYYDKTDEFNGVAGTIYENFLKIINKRKVAS